MEPRTDFTYGIDDLRTMDFPGTSLAVLGFPVRHSLSPVMHNAAIARLAAANDRFKDWAYYRFEIPPEALPEALDCFHRKAFLGLNLTIPHKIEVLPKLQALSNDARLMGAANTLLWGELGYEGFNTDGYGLATALREDLGVTLGGTDVILLGAGGAARAAAVQCLLAGCASLRIGNRTLAKAEALIETLRGTAGRIPISAFAPGAGERFGGRGVVVNATSLGLKADDPVPLDLDCLDGDWAVFDMIYNPPVTPLLRAAAARGMPCANGLAMLVHQGARSLSIWSKETVNADAMLSAATHALKLPPRYVRNL